jgi:hypothetical protein
VLTAYTQAADAFDRQAQALAGGIAGVPESITAAGVRTFRNVARTVRAQVTCLRNQGGSAKVSAKPCEDETTAATNAGLAAGASLLVLIPYGTRSQEEVVAALEAPPG